MQKGKNTSCNVHTCFADAQFWQLYAVNQNQFVSRSMQSLDID